MSIGTKLYTLLYGRRVGRDEFGNRYYVERSTPQGARAKRWVMYRGVAEPTKVPPLWHAWLHYTTDALPMEMKARHYFWEKPHIPNLTGTPHAYVPPGHVKRGARRDPSTSDYQPWIPE